MTGSTTLTFNKPTDNIAITARKLRATSGEDLNIETSNNLIFISDNFKLNTTDLSAENLTIRANNYFVGGLSLELFIANQLTSDVSFTNVDISGDLRLTNTNKTFTVLGNSILQDVSAETIDISSILTIGNLSTNNGGTIKAGLKQIIINPHPNDASGTVIIEGDLQVKGRQTTIHSNVIDISNKDIRVASNITTSSLAHGAGIIVGSSTNVNDIASLLYNDNSGKWITNIGLDVSGNLHVVGNVLPKNSTSKLPVSYNTYAIKTMQQLDDVLISDGSGNQWITAPGYDISKTLLSSNSSVKLEFKVNYICSQESEQYISFRVIKGDNPNNIVFQDLSLGNAMGVTAKNIYYGNYIDDNVGSYDPSYQLQFNVSTGTDGTLDLSSGIFGKSSSQHNYILLQELYIP